MEDSLSPGIREELLTDHLSAELIQIDAARLRRRAVDSSESEPLVLRHVGAMVSEWLRQGRTADDKADRANALAEMLGPDLLERYSLLSPPELLTGIFPLPDGLAEPSLPEHPQVPLTANELLVNDRKQPSIGSQLKTELQSAQDVDLICAFVIWSGVSTMLDELRGVVERGGRLRVITTTYMSATDPKALRELQELGAEVRVAFDAERTKLHAKAWILHRPRGLTTGFVGSSNLSQTAMHAGLEWNVRLAEAEAASVIERMKATFETYWREDAFEEFIAGRDDERLDAALKRQRRGSDKQNGVPFAGLDVMPHPHQRRMLEDLMVQRKRHDRHRNLVVAATGTGKTVVAALDYKALCQQANKRLSLLFVAHREQILQQARGTFQAVMKDSSFGEILGAGQKPEKGKQVFAMVQSLKAMRVLELDPTDYDVVIVDEFHHAEAPSYKALLSHLQPRELLGLTATPERMDGKDVTAWFDGRIAVELRVWEAIERGYLAPFQYFGVSDPTDLSQLQWKRGGYDTKALDNVVTGNTVRADRAVAAVEKWHPEASRMRALGFCVSVAHAEFMAAHFTSRGLESVAMSADTPSDERHDQLARLQRGELRCIFSVEVLGEGVDVPSVDTVILLRPTQSATLFSQQLGRGLRLSEEKAYLTVIDLIGQQHKQFRFEQRLSAIVDESTGSIRTQAEEGFPYLPSGCSMVLDSQSREIVLANLRQAATATQWATLVEELREIGDTSMSEWAEKSGRRISDLYRRPETSWTRLRRDAGLATDPPAEGEEQLLRAVRRLDHVDDPERVAFYTDFLSRESAPTVGDLNSRQERILEMLINGLSVAKPGDTLKAAVDRLWPHSAVRSELCELFVALGARSERIEEPVYPGGASPVALHAQYTGEEALLAFGKGSVGKPPTRREGVRWIEDARTDLLFVTLRKSEKTFSPSTMYRDYALTRSLFHWESQNSTYDQSPVGQRYINHQETGSEVILMVRESDKRTNGAGAPFTCLGPVKYVSHTGNRPMAVTWELEHDLPEALLESSQIISAA